jgi:hypothetical protein
VRQQSHRIIEGGSSMHFRTLAVTILASCAALSACDDGDDVTGTATSNNATVRFINATNLSLDIGRGGSVATGNGALGYGTFSNCMTVDATNPNVAVRQTGTSTALAGFTPAFQATGNYTVVMYPGAGGTTTFTTVPNAFTPTAGQGGLRVFNAAGAGTNYDIYVGTPGAALGSPAANNVSYGSGSSYFNVGTSAAQQVRITNAGSQTVMLDVGTRSFAAGQNVTLVIAPPTTGSTPRAFYVTGCS